MKASRVAVAFFSAVLLVTTWGASASAQNSAVSRQRLAGQEIMIVEKVVSARKEYKAALEKLVAFYTLTKDARKLREAKGELASLNAIPQHEYVIVAESLGPNIRPLKNIPAAEKLYAEARSLDTAPGPNVMRSRHRALNLYLTVISRYPECNRVADCAYYIGRIYEFTIIDYHRAVVYYEKTFEWDPVTAHPARIRGGRLCYYNLVDK